MLTLLRLSLLVLLGFCGAFVGAAIGALFVAPDSGMAAGAMVFWSALAGFVGAIVAGAILAWRLRKVALRLALLVAVILAALAIASIGSRLDVQAAAIQSPSGAPPPDWTYSAGSLADARHERTYFTVRLSPNTRREQTREHSNGTSSGIQSPANTQPTGSNFAAPSAANRAHTEADSNGQRPASARPDLRTRSRNESTTSPSLKGRCL